MDNVPPPLSTFRPQPPFHNWWQRHWPWAVPTGCVTLLLALAVFSGGIMFLVFGVMQSSDVYKIAVQRAETNARVINALGAPVSEGIFVTGNINVSNDAGRANLAIPVAGSKRKGTIYVVATRSEGVWAYSRMQVQVQGRGQLIDLRELAP